VTARQPLTLRAAGSLRAALSDLARRFAAGTGLEVETAFGPSGLIREAILEGAPTALFASADMENPQRVAGSLGGAVRPFARNTLCALAVSALDATPGKLLDILLAPETRIGTSTPGTDPSGDYAWQVFDRADAVRPGATAILKAKARTLVGGTFAAPATYAELVSRGDADIFLTYRTNALRAKAENPSLRLVDLPETLAVGATYGLVAPGDDPDGKRLAAFILSTEGQDLLHEHGFLPPQP